MKPALIIPQITDDNLAKLAERIKPLVRDESGQLREIKAVDHRNQTFTWSPKFIGNPVTPTEIGAFECLHKFSAPVFFKPSVAEVLAQLPAAYIDRADYFEVTAHTENVTTCEAYFHSMHVSTVTLYTLRA